MPTPILKKNIKQNVQSVKHNMKIVSTKTFQSAGKWIEKPRISEIVVCSCGNKYIKTRKDQTVCVRCMR